MKGLRISPELTLPLDAVTETFWFLGKRGSGKTHDCSVFVEEMLKALAQVVILDPMRAWYGLRSSVDGKGPGLPIAIFGGPHGDAPLEPGAGEFMAELAVRERVSMILDVKDWSKADRRKFVTAFLLRLLAINEDAMHVVLEEAARFAPQRMLDKGDAAMLGACMDLVQLGRGMGLGASLISQRSATINNEVSTQTSVLMAHRTTSPSDRKAAHGWFEFHESDLVDEAMQRLPRLATGSALIASTELFDADTLKEVHFRPRETFDSSATPKVGQAKRVARTFADIDIDIIRKQMSEIIERAEADDPRKLHSHIKALERQLAAKATTIPEPVEIEVEVVPQGVFALYEQAVSAREAASTAANVAGQSYDEICRIVNLLGAVCHAEPARKKLAPAAAKPAVPSPATKASGSGDSSLPGPQRKLLTILASYGPRTKRQLAMQSGYVMTGGAFKNPLGAMRSAGYVTRAEPMEITDEGLAALGDFESLPSGRDLLDHWLASLGGPERKILTAVAARWPRSYDKQELADEVGYEVTGGAFKNPLGRLRTLQLVTRGNEIRLTDDFAEAIT